MKLIFLMILLCLSLFAGMNNSNDMNSDIKNISTKKLVVSIVKGIQENLPMRLDEVTQVIKAWHNNLSLYLIKEIDTTNKIFEGVTFIPMEKAHKMMYIADGSSVCNNSTTRYMIFNRGIIFHYNYVDKKLRTLFSHSINKDDCKKIKNQ
ncbi:MAG: hypothetical protein HRT42_10990 [Campylobacteraceae bacterium]|nr:hypothetical protein [Campylobacteraceae bacterium]